MWIPTIENMLEDALLMIGLYVLEDQKLLELAKKYFDNFEADQTTLYDDIAEEDRKKLYKECRKLDDQYKIVITSFDDEKFRDQIQVLKEYSMDVSVCALDYKRWYSKWQDEVKTKGALN